jgi:hypothetical protein
MPLPGIEPPAFWPATYNFVDCVTCCLVVSTTAQVILELHDGMARSRSWPVTLGWHHIPSLSYFIFFPPGAAAPIWALAYLHETLCFTSVF